MDTRHNEFRDWHRNLRPFSYPSSRSLSNPRPPSSNTSSEVPSLYPGMLLEQERDRGNVGTVHGPGGGWEAEGPGRPPLRPSVVEVPPPSLPQSPEPGTPGQPPPSSAPSTTGSPPRPRTVPERWEDLRRRTTTPVGLSSAPTVDPEKSSVHLASPRSCLKSRWEGSGRTV